jgi:hypothetical protein
MGKKIKGLGVFKKPGDAVDPNGPDGAQPQNVDPNGPDP